MEDMRKDFEIFRKQAEEFIQKWGLPHRKIIIDQNGIEIVDAIKVKSFGLFTTREEAEQKLKEIGNKYEDHKN